MSKQLKLSIIMFFLFLIIIVAERLILSKNRVSVIAFSVAFPVILLVSLKKKKKYSLTKLYLLHFS